MGGFATEMAAYLSLGVHTLSFIGERFRQAEVAENVCANPIFNLQFAQTCGIASK
jgi:hypothetical protein